MPNGARGRAGPQLRSSGQAELAASILNLDSEEQAGQENNLSCYNYTEVFADFMDLCVINCHLAGGAPSLPSVGVFLPFKC